VPYPPGTWAGDPRAPWNEPHHHEHEFEPRQDKSPIIEDGAAIFHEGCIYAEGEYGQGWQCEKKRTYRFEYSTLESPSGREWDDHDLPENHAEKVITIEQAFNNHGPSDEVSWDVDPNPESGHVTIEYKGWKLHFRP